MQYGTMQGAVLPLSRGKREKILGEVEMLTFLMIHF